MESMYFQHFSGQDRKGELFFSSKWLTEAPDVDIWIGAFINTSTRKLGEAGWRARFTHSYVMSRPRIRFYDGNNPNTGFRLDFQKSSVMVNESVLVWDMLIHAVAGGNISSKNRFFTNEPQPSPIQIILAVDKRLKEIQESKGAYADVGQDRELELLQNMNDKRLEKIGDFRGVEPVKQEEIDSLLGGQYEHERSDQEIFWNEVNNP